MTEFTERCESVVKRLPQIANDLFYIRTETGGFQKISPNAVQQHYHADRAARGFASHDVILKARKHGVSTWKLLEGLALTLFVDGFSGVVMGDDKDKTQRLFDIMSWAYQRLPEDLKKSRKLDTDRRDAISIGGSTIHTATAGSRTPLRSETIHWALLTEVAWYRDAEKIMSGVTEAMAEGGIAAHITRESTPAGRNWFYQLCTAARDGDVPDKLYFYEWWWSPKYKLPLDPGEVIVPTEEEKALIALAARGGFELSPEQLKWRRWKNQPTELGARDDSEEAEFAQEYVEDFESCFLVGGNPIFKPQILKLLDQQTRSAWAIDSRKYPNGELVVWREAGKYPTIAAVDVAEGLAGGDWSAVTIWENTPEKLQQLARLKIRCSTIDLAQHIKDLAARFHNPLAIVERNAMGLSVIYKLEELGYYHLYNLIDNDGQPTEHYGWQTTNRSKQMMIGEFKDEVEAGNIIINDSELVEQMGNITYDEFGKIVTPKNRHDDIFMSSCMAVMARDQAGFSAGGGFSAGSRV